MTDLDTITPQELAGMIDHTFLKAFGGPEPIEKLCAEAREYGFAMVAVNPAEVERCVELLKGSKVRVGAAVGFPLGQMTSAAKAFEIRDSIEKGAGEVDMVQNVRALQSGNETLVLAELEDLAKTCREHGVISKVILETCYLTDEEKVRSCELAVKAGVDFVKTSTGFGAGGATTTDIALMRRIVGPTMGVKAAGGVRTLDEAFGMIAAGATRIGTSAGVAIVDALAERRRLS
jgi:deoxyribose-phosphate aldolase